MSFMFKEMLNQLDGRNSNNQTQEPIKINENGDSIKNNRLGYKESLVTRDTGEDEKQYGNEFSRGGTNEACRKSLSKRGKKKISSMLGKLQSSIKQTKLKSNDEINGEHKGNNNIDDDQDEFCEALCDGFENVNHNQTNLDKSSSIHNSKWSNDDDYDDNKGDAVLLPEEQCDIPTFANTKNCAKHLIDETRILLKERYAKNPDNFYENDLKRMLEDDWTVTRFLLRRRLNPKRTAKLMEECGRFRKQYKMSEVKLWEFPQEFHQAGGLFAYAPDRVGNRTLYMRVRMYRRVPEISDVFKAFILCVLEECDVANNGRGVAVIFDLTGCGLQNVDLGFLSWLLSSFRNYCPKGVSYILVYNLPWILNATCKLAMTWMSASNRRALRFVHGDEIENFIAKENLPDYIPGGCCKTNYRAIPEGSKPAIEVCDRLDMTREQAIKIRELFKEYLVNDTNDDEFHDAKSKDDESITTVCDSSIGTRDIISASAFATTVNTNDNQHEANVDPISKSSNLVSTVGKFAI